jgi:hypothetical protein
MKKIKPTQKSTEQEAEFMEKLDHPFKAEVQMMREMILQIRRYRREKAALEKVLKDLIKLQKRPLEKV